MTQQTYKMSHYPGIIVHGTPSTAVTMVRDEADIDMDRLELLATVRSGDYLVTLATTLDIMSQLLLEANHAERDNLQKIVNDLLYLQSRYKLVKKD